MPGSGHVFERVPFFCEETDGHYAPGGGGRLGARGVYRRSEDGGKGESGRDRHYGCR